MEAVRSLGRAIVAFSILSHLSLLAYSSSPQDLQILNAERRYGVFKPEPGSVARAGMAIDDYVLNLSAIAAAGLFNGLILNNSDCFHEFCKEGVAALLASASASSSKS